MSLHSDPHNPPPGAQAFLRSLSLFAGLNDEQLSEVARHLQRRGFAAGVTLYHQDMPGIMLYMIESGRVRLFSAGRTGHEFTHNIFGPGDILGELPIIDGKHHSGTAITLLPTVVWILPRADMEDLLERHPPVMLAMTQMLAARVRLMTSHAEGMIFQDVQGRLAHEILRLAIRHGQPSPPAPLPSQTTGEGSRAGEVEIGVPLTQVDLASMVGATRESVNKAMTALRAQNLVRVDGTRLIVVDPAGLQQMVQERGR